MYICPTCKKEFVKEEDVTKHYLICWKRQNPNHKSNTAPRSDDKVIRYVNDNVLEFFSKF